LAPWDSSTTTSVCAATSAICGHSVATSSMASTRATSTSGEPRSASWFV